jgi:hypothetical protein|tara:strand:+ start:3153 stop:3371 length:219 start_codon:yes stop_codon:yes gene_type:complete
MKQKIDTSIIEIDTQSGLTILNLLDVIAITKTDYSASVDIHMMSGTVFTVRDDEYADLAQAWMIVAKNGVEE